MSKNYGLKIPVRARARVCMRGQIVIRTHDHDQHKTSTPPEHRTRPEHTTIKGRNTGKQNLRYWGDLHGNNEKK